MVIVYRMLRYFSTSSVLPVNGNQRPLIFKDPPDDAWRNKLLSAVISAIYVLLGILQRRFTPGRLLVPFELA